MGICTRRHFLLSVCILQLISTVIRQVFDFLGYMWIPILVNFFEIIFIIFGFFGAFQYQPKYVISYSVWNLVLLAWNLFLVCLYLDIGILNHQESKVLKLDQESSSWWESNGPGCNVTYNTTDLPRPAKKVTDCLLNYVHVEVFQASFQCLLAFLGCITGLCLGSTYLEKDDSFDGECSTPELDLHPMYVSETNIPLSPSQYYSPFRKPIIFNDTPDGPIYRPVNLFTDVQTDYSDSDDDRKVNNKFYPSMNVLSYGHAPMSRHLARVQNRPKTALYADRIRTTATDTPLSLSYDRLHFNDVPHRTETFDRARPKSFCNNI